MEVKSLRTLTTIHFKLLPFPPRPQASKQSCATLYTLPALFRGWRGGLFEASELLQKWILCYICILDMLELEGRFYNCPKDFGPPLYIMY